MSVEAIKPVRIIIFAKAPQAGFAKTRLIPALGAEGAAQLAQQMLLHTLQVALASSMEMTSSVVETVELCTTPTFNDAVWRDIPLPQGTTLPQNMVVSDQGEGDLGERMARAAQRGIEQGNSVILIGTDCVEMSTGLLNDAVQTLNTHDAIIHCTKDGGYALLGLNKFNAGLFSDIAWSTDAVASTTLSRIGQLGWSLHVGQMLHDVDEAQDLKYLSDHQLGHLPGHLAGHISGQRRKNVVA
ncbi:MAG: TIGR04282 family arsenosugar biosynthesis glycosyltransferase [Gallionella sp.]